MNNSYLVSCLKQPQIQQVKGKSALDRQLTMKRQTDILWPEFALRRIGVWL